MFKNVLTHKGRIRRTEYGLTYLGYLIVANGFDFFLLSSQSTSAEIIGIILILFSLWILIVQGAKRCHDRGNSGWYQIIPFYGLWMLFADSDDGPNKYGDNPKGIGNYDEVDEIGKIENE